jgi:hypothetical protein
LGGLQRGFTTKLLGILLIVAFLSLPLTGLQILTKAATEPASGFFIKNHLLTFWTPFYNITLNLSKGISIWRVRFYNGFTFYPLTCIKGFPSFILLAFTDGNGPLYNNIIVGNETYRTLYPGSSLSLYTWTANLMYRSDSEMAFILTPTKKALQSIKPLKVNIIIKVYYFKPIIEFNVTFTNPSKSRVLLKGETIKDIKYGPGMGIVTCSLKGREWDQIAITYTNNSLQAIRLRLDSLNNITKMSKVVSVLLSNPKGSSQPKNILLIKPITPKPEGITGFNKLTLQPVGGKEKITNITLYSVFLVYKPLNLSASKSVSYVFDLLLAHIEDPASIFLYDLGHVYYSLNKNWFYSSLNQVMKFKEIVNNLTNLEVTNNNLRKRVSNLERKCSNLSKSLDEALGKIDYFKVNYNLLKENIADLNHKLKKCFIIEISLLIIGIIVGVFGGWIIHSIKSSGVGKRSR